VPPGTTEGNPLEALHFPIEAWGRTFIIFSNSLSHNYQNHPTPTSLNNERNVLITNVTLIIELC